MADTKISGLAAVTDVQTTDEFVLARSGTTKKITGADLASELGGGADAPAYQQVIPLVGYTVVQGTWTVTADNAQAGGFWLQNTAVQNDELAWPLLMAAGTWTIQSWGVRSTDGGIATVLIDASSVGTMDFYNGSAIRNQSRSITGVTVATTGVKTVSLKMATKHASSSAYRLYLTSLTLLRTA